MPNKPRIAMEVWGRDTRKSGPLSHLLPPYVENEDGM